MKVHRCFTIEQEYHSLYLRCGWTIDSLGLTMRGGFAVHNSTNSEVQFVERFGRAFGLPEFVTSQVPNDDQMSVALTPAAVLLPEYCLVSGPMFPNGHKVRWPRRTRKVARNDGWSIFRMSPGAFGTITPVVGSPKVFYLGLSGLILLDEKEARSPKFRWLY